MDKLSDGLDRQIVVVMQLLSAGHDVSKKRAAGLSFFWRALSDLLTKNRIFSPKIYTDFKKAGSFFSTLDYFSSSNQVRQ
jgi:hypothetical protein